MKTKSALSYFGSDSEVAAEIAALLNHCAHVTIPFCGGLSILPHLTARSIVANDAHLDVINFYWHLSGTYGPQARQTLIEMCQRTLSHPAELDQAIEYLRTNERRLECNVARAWAYWACCWIGRKGKGGTKHLGGQPSIRRTPSGGSNASRIRSAASDLDAWADQLRRCEFSANHFRDVIPAVADRDDCGLYCDPPWIKAGHNYAHTFTDADHVKLAELLHRFTKATVVVRYDDVPLVRDLYQDWRIIEADSRTQSNGDVREIWITK